ELPLWRPGVSRLGLLAGLRGLGGLRLLTLLRLLPALLHGRPPPLLWGLLLCRAVVHRRPPDTPLPLVRGEAGPLLIQLVDGERCQVALQLLLVVRQTHLQGIDALFERSDPLGKLTVVGGHALACAIDSNPTTLCLAQSEVEVLDRSTLLPHPGFEGV